MLLWIFELVVKVKVSFCVRCTYHAQTALSIFPCCLQWRWKGGASEPAGRWQSMKSLSVHHRCCRGDHCCASALTRQWLNHFLLSWNVEELKAIRDAARTWARVRAKKTDFSVDHTWRAWLKDKTCISLDYFFMMPINLLNGSQRPWLLQNVRSIVSSGNGK